LPHFDQRLLTVTCRLLLLLPISSPLLAQLTTGIVQGTVNDSSGTPQSGVEIIATGPARASRWSVSSDSDGNFRLILPHGVYQIHAGSGIDATPAVEMHVSPSKVSRILMTVGANPTTRFVITPNTADLHSFPESLTLAGTLLREDTGTVVQPLDFTGLQNTRIPLISHRSFSWTGTGFSVEGVDATDSYQPGYPLVFPDVQALDAVTVKNTPNSNNANAFASEIGLFSRTAGERWHGLLESSETGAALSSGNLPAPANRGILKQPSQYNWFTRDRVELSGPIGSRADVFLSAAGQWASQTVPIGAPGNNLHTRLLFGNFNSRVQLTSKDQVSFLFTGSRINLSNWGEPLGLEALIGWRIMPAYESPYGFSGLSEVDHLDLFQAGWTHQFPASLHSGLLEVKYGASIAHLDTGAGAGAQNQQSSTDLLGAVVTGPAPLSNLAVRQSQSLRAMLQLGDVRLGPQTHRLILGGDWQRSNAQNRFNAPSDLDLITAAGVPAYVVELNTPLDSRTRVQSFTAYIRDQIEMARWFRIDLGVLGDFSRGSLPAQGSPPGVFVPARQFPGRADLIDWNTASPHAGLAFSLPGLERLTFQGSYSRTYAPLAGHYLDFANPNSLSGLVYQWNDRNGDRVFQPDEEGQFLRRFGGAYATISPSLSRPYADEFDIGAAASVGSRTSLRIQLFRRDEKGRIAATDVGVPAQAYQPVTILDPGPDGIFGTFDDRRLTVYQQNPATFGQDEFLLTNPSDLRMLYEGFTAEVFTSHKYLDLHVSFTTEKSFGPTNPGNGSLENDSGVIGALYQDPNTLINATGHDFFDRSFLGKIETISRLPPKLGGLEIVNVADYLDGLPFARELLVTGLAQGPMVVATTLRGSPEGGNRAEYVLNWNLRLARTFALPKGRIGFSVDVLNVTNSGNRIQENDLTGTNFNARLPVEIQAPRSVRFGVQYSF